MLVSLSSTKLSRGKWQIKEISKLTSKFFKIKVDLYEGVRCRRK